MKENKEIALNLLEEQVLFLVEDINYQREKEYLRVLKLKKEIIEFYKIYRLKNKSGENKKININYRKSKSNNFNNIKNFAKDCNSRFFSKKNICESVIKSL